MTGAAESVRDFKSAHGRALLSAILFFIAAFLLLLLAGVLLASLPLIRSIDADPSFWQTVATGQAMPDDAYEVISILVGKLHGWLNDVVEIASVITFSAMGIAAIAFVLLLFWTFQAHRNLAALGADDVRYSSWAVLWWFVPLVQLFGPYQLVNEIWRLSDPAGAREGPHRPRPARALLRWWGALLVVSLVLEYGWLLSVGIFPQRFNALASFEVLSVIIVQEVLLGLLCFFTALVVLTIDGMQTGRHRLTTAPGSARVASYAAGDRARPARCARARRRAFSRPARLRRCLDGVARGERPARRVGIGGVARFVGAALPDACHHPRSGGAHGIARRIQRRGRDEPQPVPGRVSVDAALPRSKTTPASAN